MGEPRFPNLEAVVHEELRSWPAPAPSAAVLWGGEGVVSCGPARSYEWASVTKLLTALVVLDCWARGEVDLEEPAGPPGSTVRHLLAHASGLSVDSDRVLSAPGRRRIYSNRGFEVLGELVGARLGAGFDSVLDQRVLAPLGMNRTTLTGSPAHGARGPLGDLVRLARELLEPRLLRPETLRAARTVAFPDLSGVLPGFGRQEPNDWGLGFEVRGSKAPHWTSPFNSPETFGHFGQQGAFLWVDPVAGAAVVTASDTPFGPWAATAWPALSSRVLKELVPGAVPERSRAQEE